MKILISSQYYYPEQVGIAVYAHDLALYLSGIHHDVSVITGFPFYPKWKKRKEDYGRLFGKEKLNNICCYRGYLYVPSSGSVVKRILSELSFDVFAFFNFIRAGRQDLIVVESPPASLGLIAYFFSRVWQAKLVIHVQDIQSDAAVSLEMVRKSGVLPRVLKKIEKFLYDKSDLIVAISNGMKNQIVGNGCAKGKVDIVYNWVVLDPDDAFISGDRSILGLNDVEDKFIIAYAGNQGVKQGLDIIINLAHNLIDNKKYHFLIIGDGIENKRLRTMASEYELDNVSFIPFFEKKTDYIKMLRSIDVAFISQRNGTANSFFPSKLLSILSCRVPLLASVDPESETFQVIRDYDLGLAYRYGDIESLANGIDELYMHDGLRYQYASNGLTWSKLHDREITLPSLNERLLELMP